MKRTTRRLALDAMLSAMFVVLSMISISLPNMKITLDALPVLVASLLFGPLDGLSVGLIGSFLVDVLMEKNTRAELDCTVYALGRNKEKAGARFAKFADDPRLIFIPYDVKLPFAGEDMGGPETFIRIRLPDLSCAIPNTSHP